MNNKEKLLTNARIDNIKRDEGEAINTHKSYVPAFVVSAIILILVEIFIQVKENISIIQYIAPCVLTFLTVVKYYNYVYTKKKSDLIYLIILLISVIQSLVFLITY